jgi:hypothetical protein
MPPRSPRARFRSAAGWVALALLGLVVAAGISLAASRLSSQHIGLSAEPIGAGQSLSPKDDGAVHKQPSRSHRHKSKHGGTTQTTPTQTQIAPPVQPAPVQPAPVQPAPVTPQRGDDSGGDDSGGRGGRGGDD